MAGPTKNDYGEGGQGALVLHLVISGPDVQTAIALPAQGILSIGRHEDAEVRLLDPRASRCHARLHVGQDIRIEDAGSGNGTWVAGKRIAAGELVPLPVGAAAVIGDTTLLLQERWVRPDPLRIRSHGFFFDRLVEECINPASSFAVLRVHVSAAFDPARVSEAIAPHLRLGDVVAAYAPHEYEILLPDSAPGKCQDLAMRIEQSLAGGDPRLGLALFPQHGLSAGEILAHACDQVRNAPLAGGDAVVGDPVMQALYTQAKQAAQSNAAILILGETGVGKEVLARFVQKESRRAGRSFVTINCAAMAESLLDEELFGHERGAFTDAKGTREGRLEAANGGTVFLDEVGEMSPAMQAKLLRALDQGEITRIGSNTTRKIDVRFMAATNRNLREEVEAGRFREDLYHRLAVFTLRVPPLRERKAEIEPLVRRFLLSLSEKSQRPTPDLSPAALALLVGYDWPGNVRDLRNAVERALALCPGDTITPEHLDLERLGPGAGKSQAAMDPRRLFESANGDAEAENRIIRETLSKCAGNQTRAAELLGISRFALMRRLKDLSVPRPRLRRPTPVLQ